MIPHLSEKGYNHSIDYCELSKIENDRLEIQSTEYDWLIPILAEIFNVNVEWLEQIRQQTSVESLDLKQGIFPIYVKHLEP